MNFTVTPEVTALGPIDQSATGDPLDETGDEIELGLSGGDWQIGYDFVETADGPQWHIWLDGEVVVVSPDDPLLTSLLNSYMIQADKRAQATKDLVSAEEDLSNAIASGAGGLLSLVGGGAAAVVGCSGVPLTFWAAGGTGWVCAGGVVASVGGGVALGASVSQGLQAGRAKADAQERFDDSNREVRELFGAIQEHVAESP